MGKILIVGPVQSGKSSLINSFASIKKNRICTITTEWNHHDSVTKTYREFKCGSTIFADTMGSDYEKSESDDYEDFLAAVKGHMKHGFTFVPGKPISKTDPMWRSNPSNADKVHCVIFCIPASHIPDMPRVLKAKMNKMLTVLKDLHVPFMFVLTKIDELSLYVQQDIKNTFWSKKVHNKVKQTSEVFDAVAEELIYPVKNFTTEVEINPEPSYLLLLAWKKAIELAQDRVEEM